MSLTIQQCIKCRRNYFPFRLICRHCSAAAFESIEVETGIVEQTSILSDGTVLATIRLSDDDAKRIPSNEPFLDEVRVIGRLHCDAANGVKVELSISTALSSGQAYVPQGPQQPNNKDFSERE